MIARGWENKMAVDGRYGALFATLLAAGSAGSAVTTGQGASSPYDAAVIGGAYAAGDEIGAAAMNGHGGYDGGAPTGSRGGRGPADRPCYVRRAVYDGDGTLIGYRGQQLC